jgi:ribosomal protein S18 acetylase RimI-like enzyme
LARGLTAAVEEAARAAGFRVLNLDVRATQAPAIAMYEARGYVRWGTHPRYALVDGEYVQGHFYTKEL